MDGSGVNALIRLLESGLEVRYSPYIPRRRLKSMKFSESRRRLIANAINRGQLKEVKFREAVSDTERIIISYIAWLGADIDNKDLASVYREISERSEKPGVQLIQTGLHELGLMDRLAQLLAGGGLSLYYLPLPRVFRKRVPLAGPPVDAETRSVLSALAGRRQILAGLHYMEAEAAALAQLFSEAASYAAAVEVGLMLYRRYGVLHSESVHKLTGYGRTVPWRGRLGGSLLILIEELEGDMLQKSLVARAISKVIKESDKVLSELLTRRLSSKSSARVLLADAPPEIIERVRRRFRTLCLRRSDLLSRAELQRIDAAVVSSAEDEILHRLRNMLSEGGIVIDLNYFRCIKIEK